MLSSWQEFSLGDICTKITDGAHNSPKSVLTGMPMASVKDLTEFGVNLKSARQISIDDYEFLVKQGCRPEIGDILIAKDGNTALDTTCIVNQELQVVMLSSVAILRPDKNKLDSNYLKFWFRSKKTLDYLKSNFISGAAIPRVVLKDFRKAKIMLPDLAGQRKIVSVLQPIEDKIQLNHETNNKLELLAQTIFKSWFVDFDPVHAKRNALEAGLTKAQAEHAAMAVIAGLCSPSDYAESSKEIERKLFECLTSIGKNKAEELKTTASFFPSALDKHDLPDGWATQELGSLCWLNKNTWNAKNAPESIVYVDLANTKNGSILETTKYSWNEAPSRARRILNDGDTIIGTVRPGNRSFVYIQNMKEQLTASTGFAVLTPKNDIYNEIVYLFSTSDSSIDHLAHIADGGAYPSVRPEEIAKMSLTVPREELVKVFHHLTSDLISSLSLRRMENQNLVELRDALLPKLLSGEIDLSEVLLD